MSSSTQFVVDVGTYAAFKCHECGHQWLSTVQGFYGCPGCGNYDGDHDVTWKELDPRDWVHAIAWGVLKREANWNQRLAHRKRAARAER